MKYLLDTSSWIEYLEGSGAGKKVWEIIKDTNSEIFTLNINIAEVVSKFKRRKQNFKEAYDAILLSSSILTISPPIAKEAGLLHAEMKMKIGSFAMADAFVAAAAKKEEAIIVTKDSHFKSFKNVLMLK